MAFHIRFIIYGIVIKVKKTQIQNLYMALAIAKRKNRRKGTLGRSGNFNINLKLPNTTKALLFDDLGANLDSFGCSF
jgi:hypothetical protein